VIGRLEVPRLGMSAMVREGDDAATLRHAVGHIPQTALPGESGNAGLAGHRDTFFRGLKSVRIGDRLIATTPRGTAEYVVQRISIVDPDDVSVLNPTSGPTLTLVTCYPFYYIGAAPRRFIVHAELATDRRQ
jgi:sortase A